MSDRALAFSDLVSAWISYQTFEPAHPDLAGYHERRYRAMASAFGADLTKAPESAPPVPAWMTAQIQTRIAGRGGDLRWTHESWAKDIHRFLVRTEQTLRGINSPFSGFVEIDPTLYAARSQFDSAVAAPLHEARARWRAMILELFKAIFPDAADRTVDRKQLIGHGFDESLPEPDVDDYW